MNCNVSYMLSFGIRIPLNYNHSMASILASRKLYVLQTVLGLLQNRHYQIPEPQRVPLLPTKAVKRFIIWLQTSYSHIFCNLSLLFKRFYLQRKHH
ncbi:hypothetical protein L1987_07276 [Smallanthus sonchifolius]|uniref:Uncharacterized protein n=1 Tax=Smallanthus sonchifolius TaxID=185202 RepID=A0ACB9K065_9ASTR|nr:hypothetical protein L1987_07276 [Smallanthus sonchifolius]